MQLLKPSWVHHNEGQAIFSVDIHPDGSRFATGGQGQGQDASGRVVIWNMKPIISDKNEQDPACPKLLCQLDQHLGCVNCVRWSCSGRYLASAGDDKVVIIWQLSNYGGGAVFGSNVVNVEWWRCVSTLRGHDGDILDVAWAPHDTYLASVSVDNTVIIWNACKWPERVRILRGHRGLVKGVTWDPVGRYVASQADDRTLVVWRTKDWGQETSITKPFQECGGTTSVLRPSWSPDGQYLVSAHAMNNGGPTAKIIDRDNWVAEKDFVGHRKPITCVRFNPNILKKTKTAKSVQYCCAAIGSRDRSVSIWFTSLKRPLVVIHDVFEDSVLDLSFSRCGRHLLAVSKDGSLAAITFSAEEMGQPLSQDEIDSVYIKLYGKCTSNTRPASAAIIDNPELLKAKQQALTQLQQPAPQPSEGGDTKSCPSTPRRGPDKQIERRTADGRRRITPVFIPPSADGGSMKTFESFSTSRTEKSQIIIEKLDGIVEPNVSTPSKGNSNSSTPPSKHASKGGSEGTAMPPPPQLAELEDVNPDLSSRMDSKIPSKPQDSPANPNLKRKFEEPQPIAVKRKRGRPPLDRSALPPTPASPPPVPPSPLPAAPPTPAMMRALPATPAIQAQPSAAVATGFVSRNVIAPASLGSGLKFQTKGASPLTVTVENKWREVGGPSGGSLHRISGSREGHVLWRAFTNSPVTAVASSSAFIAMACRDCCLQLLCPKTGSLLLPPLQLDGGAAKLLALKSHLLVLTATAQISLYNVSQRKKVLVDCVRHLVEGRVGQDGVKSIHLLPIKSPSPTPSPTDTPTICNGDTPHPLPNGCASKKIVNGEASTESTSPPPPEEDYSPVVVLGSGEVFSLCRDLGTWLQLGETSCVLRLIKAQYTSLPPSSSTLNALLRHTTAHGTAGGLQSDSSKCDSDIQRVLTENYLKKMLTSSAFLGSRKDFHFWYTRLIHFYIKEGQENELREAFDELLSDKPAGEGAVSTVMPKYAHLLDSDKKGLLRSLLGELLLLDGGGRLQRLYSEYKELLDSSNKGMQDIMI